MLDPQPGDIVANRGTIKTHGGDVSQAPKWHVSTVENGTMKIYKGWMWKRVDVANWIVVHRPMEWTPQSA